MNQYISYYLQKVMIVKDKKRQRGTMTDEKDEQNIAGVRVYDRTRANNSTSK